MPRGVYSERFIATRVVDVAVAYTVPEDMRAVVKCIAISNPGTVAGTVAVAVHGYQVIRLNVPAGGFVLERSLHLPAYERETITAFLSRTGMEAVVAGFVFADTGSGDPPPVREGLDIDWAAPLPGQLELS